MEQQQFINWMRANNLIEISKHYKDCFKKIIKQCLNIKNEEFLIIGDLGSENKRIAPLLTMCYYLAAKELNIKSKIFIRDSLQLPSKSQEMVNTLTGLNNGGVLSLNLSNRLGDLGVLGKSFRSFVKKANHRFCAITKLSYLQTQNFKHLISAMDVDYKMLKKQGEAIKQVLDSGDMVHITTKKGTDLHYNINGKTAISNDGNYNIGGIGGNMPAGEVYIPPRSKKKIYGKVVIDGSLFTEKGTILVKHPVTLTIENDEVVKISGFNEAELLEESLQEAVLNSKYSWGVRRVSELGIGINPKASLVGVTIVDEKTLGTAHIAIGSNAWFGGTVYAINHYDQVFKNPKIYVDGKPLKV